MKQSKYKNIYSKMYFSFYTAKTFAPKQIRDGTNKPCNFFQTGNPVDPSIRASLTATSRAKAGTDHFWKFSHFLQHFRVSRR